MPPTPPPDGRAGIDAALVRRVLADQHPRWAALAVTPVARDGHDNRTYRLGDHLTVRVPTADGYVPAVLKEHAWLPVLAPRLPLPVPEPVALGEPSPLLDRPWSVRRWLDGEPLTTARVPEVALAEDLADFLVALRACDASGGPAAGVHSFHRGGDLAAYDAETRVAARRLGVAAGPAWEEALTTRWEGPPVWFHGDVAVGNLLALEGRLAAVIDFGTCGVGDPACDLVVAWTHLGGRARAAFRERVGLDAATWAPARGWALWKALVTVAGSDAPPDELRRQRRTLARVLADR